MSRPDMWMPLYIADYLRDTMHLTRDQHGGYMLLLMACWNDGGTLPNDDDHLAALAKASASEWRKMGPVLRRFFSVKGATLVHKRVQAEHRKAERMFQTKRENGLKGGRPKASQGGHLKPVGLAKDTLQGKLSETPTPSPQTLCQKVSVISSTPVSDIHTGGASDA